MKLKLSLITNCLLVITLVVSLVGLYTKMNKLENTIMSLNYNQSLMLQQLEESENNITNINKEVKDIDKLINKYSKQFGVDKNLVKAVAKIESGGKQEVVSNAGAVGTIFALKRKKELDKFAYDDFDEEFFDEDTDENCCDCGDCECDDCDCDDCDCDEDIPTEEKSEEEIEDIDQPRSSDF